MNPTPIDNALLRPIPKGWAALAYVVIVAVGIVDYVTEPEITFSLFYLVPVASAAWLFGTRVAVYASTIAAVAWLAAEVGSSRQHMSDLVYVWNFCTRLLFLLLVALLLARLHGLLVRERVLSSIDSLTGLLNPRSFREVASAEIERSRRYGFPLSLAFVDVDNFKRINDTLGHATGDRMLEHIGETLRSHLRGTDVAARYGGDEFAILLPFADGPAARAAIGKVLEQLPSLPSAPGNSLTVSVGVVTCARDPPALEALLEHADRLMYEAKSTNKNAVRYAIFSAQCQSRAGK